MAKQTQPTQRVKIATNVEGSATEMHKFKCIFKYTYIYVYVYVWRCHHFQLPLQGKRKGE